MSDECVNYATRSFTDEELASSIDNTSTFIEESFPRYGTPNLDLLDPEARKIVEIMSRAAKREESEGIDEVLERMSSKTLKKAQYIFRVTAYHLGAPTYRERDVARRILDWEVPEADRITNLWEVIKTAVSTTIRRINYGKD